MPYQDLKLLNSRRLQAVSGICFFPAADVAPFPVQTGARALLIPASALTKPGLFFYDLYQKNRSNTLKNNDIRNRDDVEKKHNTPLGHLKTTCLPHLNTAIPARPFGASGDSSWDPVKKAFPDNNFQI